MIRRSWLNASRGWVIFSRLFRNRLDRKHLVHIFVVAAFPIHVWAVVAALREVPAWILRLTILELVGVFSYPLLFALVESLLVFFSLALLVAWVPDRFLASDNEESLGRRRVGVASLLVMATTLGSVLMHLWPAIVRDWRIVFAGLLPLVILIGGLTWMRRSPRFLAGTAKVLDRLTLLTAVYTVIDLFGVGIVLLRNLFPV